MDVIHHFHWKRNYTDFTLIQIGLENSVNEDGLTVNFCGFNMTHCHFDSLLNGDFFRNPGQVHGVGEVWMKFGPAPRKLRLRVLQEDSSGRFLRLGSDEWI